MAKKATTLDAVRMHRDNADAIVAAGEVEQNFDRQAKLDRGVREDRGAARAAVKRRKPSHILVQPNQQRTTLLQ